MIERIVILIVLAGLGLIAYRLTLRHQFARAAAAAAGMDPLLSGALPGVPTIVYFTTPDCAPCRLQQTPTLNRLQTELGDRMRVIRVDATEDPDAADRWGVMTVPTLFLLDGSGQPRGVHNGVVGEAQLRRQVEALTI